MAGFNFGTIVDVKVSSGNQLRPWKIYDMVKFGGISEPSVGNTKDGGTWKAWDFTFNCPEGTYRERIFEPTAQSLERKEVDGQNGGKRQLPSDLETIQQKIAQIVSAYTKDGMEKLKMLSDKGKLNNITFEQFINIIKKLLEHPIEPTKEHNIQLKLQGRTAQDNRTFARLPNAAISNDGSVFMEKFIGTGLTMTPYELGKAKEYESAKPTNMAAVDAPITTDSPSDESAGQDVDVDALMKDL